MPSPRELLRLWLSFSVPVDRRAYALSGFGLAAVKYLCDAALVYAASGRLWTPLDYATPLLGVRGEWLRAADLSSGALLVLALWTLPFLWIGASLTFRRGLHAGLPGAGRSSPTR